MTLRSLSAARWTYRAWVSNLGQFNHTSCCLILPWLNRIPCSIHSLLRMKMHRQHFNLRNKSWHLSIYKHAIHAWLWIYQVSSCARLHSPRSGFSRARLCAYTSTNATIAQFPAVSSKEGAVIGAVLSTRKFHRGGHHWHQTHMNNCRINEISNKLKQ
jgi:hypothetical protein